MHTVLKRPARWGVRLAFAACFGGACAAPALAQAVRPTAATAGSAEVDADDLPLPQQLPTTPPAGVRKITDGSLSCEQLYAESRSLEQVIATHRATAESAQREAQQVQEAVMKQAMGPGAGMAGMAASSLLGMLPGGGMVSGMAAQAAVESRMAAVNEASTRMMQAYQRVADAQQQQQWASARNDHLIDLFLRRNCSVPTAAGTVPADPPAR